MKNEIKIFFCVFILYFFFIHWYGWNEQSHLALTKAIAEESRFEIDSFHNTTGDRSFFNQHYYSDKDPGLALISQPVYALWSKIYSFLPSEIKEKYNFNPRKFYVDFSGNEKIYWYVELGVFNYYSMILLTTFSSVLFSSLTVVLIYKFSSIFIEGEKLKILVTVVYALGTLQFPYSLHFMNHATATFFAFLSFYIFFFNDDWKKMFLSGIFLGFAVVVDHLLVLFAFLFLFYSLFKKGKLFKFIFPAFLLATIPLMVYNYLNFGNPLIFASSYMDKNIFTQAYEISQHSLQIKKFSIFDFDQIIRILHLEAKPNPFIMLRLLFYPYRGFFFYHSVLILSIPGLFIMRKKYNLETFFSFFLLFSFTLAISMRRVWWGGFCFGERYFLPITPFLFIPVIYLIGLKEKVRKIFFILATVSIFFNVLGLNFAEDYAYDWSSMDVRENWLKDQNSFKILYNPIFDHYLPQFLKYGPRSRILEELLNGYFYDIDIRISQQPCGFKCEKVYEHKPFLSLLIFSLPLFFFKNLLSDLFKKLRIGKKT